MDDRHLLAKYVKTKDTEAFNTLVARYQSLVYGSCRRLLNNEAYIDDAVQEVFLSLAKNASKIKRHLTGWLYVCAVHTALEMLRSERSRKHRGQTRVVQPHYADSRSGANETKEALDVCLEELKPAQRELIVQYYFLNNTQAVIAERLGVSRQAVQKRLAKATKHLGRKLSKRGIAVVAASLTVALKKHIAEASVSVDQTAMLTKIGVTELGKHGVAVGTIISGVAWLTKIKVMAVVVAFLVAGAFITHHLLGPVTSRTERLGG